MIGRPYPLIFEDMHHEFTKLQVYSRSVELAVKVVAFCDSIRPYRLGEQVAASSFSIASNIAEGASRGTDKQFVTFLYYANGSTSELYTQLDILNKSGRYPEIEYSLLMSECVQIGKMLYKLIERIKSQTPRVNV